MWFSNQKKLEYELSKLRDQISVLNHNHDKSDNNTTTQPPEYNLLDIQSFATAVSNAKSKAEIETLYAKRKMLNQIAKSERLTANNPRKYRSSEIKDEKIEDEGDNNMDLDINGLLSEYDKLNPIIKGLINSFLRSKGIEIEQIRQNPAVVYDLIKKYTSKTQSSPPNAANTPHTVAIEYSKENVERY
jgi:hypothetical protein